MRRRLLSDRSGTAMIEALEGRQLLSATLADTNASPDLVPVTLVAISPLARSGTAINAEVNEPFKAVVGRIARLPAVPAGYTLQGSINWGDSTAASPAQFIHEANGAIAVIGSHTYANAGSDIITITLVKTPPAGTTLPIILVGTIKSTAHVIAENGGVTLTETAGVAFTAGLGTFHTSLSSLTLTAIISWGDGQISVGKILALPGVAGVPGAFQVVGTHTYAYTGSYLVHITVLSQVPSPVVSPVQPTPPVILVASFDSVIDVLPLSPVVTPL